MPFCFCCLDGEFEDVEEFAGIASALAQHGSRFLQFYLLVFEKDIAGDGVVQELEEVVFAERFQHIDLASGEERTDDLERWVLGGGTNEGDDTLFHSSEQ